VSAALLDLLQSDPAADRSRSATSVPDVRTVLRWDGSVDRAAGDDDLQLALFVAYELHYRGVAGVSEHWEWHPELLRARQQWEELLCSSLMIAVGAPDSLAETDAAATIRRLTEVATASGGRSLAQYLMREADHAQFVEFLTHRSIYHLKEADPHSWAIPRLSGPVKAALVTIQADEYGLGRTEAMHSELFRELLTGWGLDGSYGHYLDVVPGVTLLTTNLTTMFGLSRRWRGALVGHLSLFEMSSSIPNARYARGHRRLGGSDAAARFFDEHVVADAVHEQIAAYDLGGGLVAAEPHLAGDVIFGARCAQYADDQFAAYVLGRWDAGKTSLLVPGTP